MDDKKDGIISEKAIPLLETRQITKVYGEKIKTQVLHGVDLIIEKKEFVSIIGPSGCGKTTLLNILGTLDNATSGEIIFEGKNLTAMKPDELAAFRNQNLGFIFQFHHLLPEFTAIENVLIPTWIKDKRSGMKHKEHAEYLLETVGLKEYMNKKSTDLSGGQQQRVAIARALINSPQIILADEPTGNLDTESTAQAYELFRKINHELHTTMLIVTHDSELARKSDRIIKMKDGLIEKDCRTGVDECIEY
ncbi:ABC transporter ATP-binding protein [Proteocatella sphenisci]|uniref:ABC transporter ATP-binding protein n=1 Tax=Proteocatella sphenisci TaxID=181070 RepID=UPI0004BB91AF|nr:ABC transporter ATP-binding protein [Proteocatella sphenisci]